MTTLLKILLSRRRLEFGFILGMLTTSLVAAELPLPTDPLVTSKVLPNGLRYYIRANGQPENRAQLRFVLNAGSIQEAEDQLGLAHFIEHMAFNGTENFEKQALVDFLESIGMKFGADLNAYTGFDETVYFLEIPTDRPEIMERAFVVLRDWSRGIMFEAEEIEKERGVVLEEWRLGRGAQGRLRDLQIPVLFHDSRYATRLPIGQVEIIQNAPREAFARFYRDWYRPDLAAVIAVGDFDGVQIEGLITKYFGDWQTPPGAPKRVSHPVTDHEETLFSIESDPELTYTMVQIAYKRDPQPQAAASDYRRSLVENLYTGMLNRRLSERVQEANPPYLFAAINKVAMVRSKDVVIQTAVVKDGQFETGLQALLVEANRCVQAGFTESELSRMKADILRTIEQAYEERDTTESVLFAEEYTRNFLTGEPYPGIAKELELTREFLADIKVTEVNQSARNWITPTNRVILFSAPANQEQTMPTEQDILAVMAAADQKEVAAYDDGNIDRPLIEAIPVPGRIVRETELPDVGVTEWILGNGLRVYLKPTDFKNDQIIMQAFSPGGHSLVTDQDFVPASTATMITAQSGLGNFNLVDLRKKLAGQVAYVSASLNETYESLSGAASPRDLETFFQLINLHFTAPRADEQAFDSLRSRMQVMVANRTNDPESVFADAIEAKLFADHPRHLPWSTEVIEQMDRERSLSVFQDRFSDAGDFTFVFVGAFEYDAMRPLVEHYLGSLINLDRTEQPQFRGDEPIGGQHYLKVEKGIENKSQVNLIFSGAADWSNAQRYLLRSLVEVLQIRLREILREDQGGVYGVSVAGNLERRPWSGYLCRISFGCDPEKVDDLIALTFDAISELQMQGIPEGYLQKVREIQLRSYEKGLRENEFWLSNLSFYLRHGLAMGEIMAFPNKPETLSSRRIAEAAARFFNLDNSLVARLLPESQP